MDIFKDNEQAYLRWLVVNADGFVVNTTSTPSPGYLVLHTAQCRTIGAEGPGNYTNRDYIKVCSTERSELRRWAQDTVGGNLERCSVCDP